MGARLICDCHLHTCHSPDGRHTPERMADRAAELGIPVIALTDHCEAEEYYAGGYCTAASKAFAAAAALRDRKPGPEVLAGIELGQPGADFALCDRILTAHSYDFVLASLHRLPNFPDFYYFSDTPERASLLLSRYWDAMLRLVQWGNFDALAHVTYPLRHIVGTFGQKEFLSRPDEKLDEVLSLLARKDKALEINTAGLRQKGGLLLPQADVLRRFREMGGRRVTLGSDAHSAEELGAGIVRGVEAARAAGFTAVTVYRQREPFSLPI